MTRIVPSVRQLRADDAAAFQALRLEGLAHHPLQFRVAVEDELSRPLEAAAHRLTNEYVVGGPLESPLLGIGGLTRFAGAKLEHKALLWGMYVREEARGSGLAGAIVEALLGRATADGVETVVLTVAADNLRARRLYERWGFSVYGIEPRSFKVDGVCYDEALMVWQAGQRGTKP